MGYREIYRRIEGEFLLLRLAMINHREAADGYVFRHENYT
jgi:hypothetical protein